MRGIVVLAVAAVVCYGVAIREHNRGDDLWAIVLALAALAFTLAALEWGRGR